MPTTSCRPVTILRRSPARHRRPRVRPAEGASRGPDVVLDLLLNLRTQLGLAIEDLADGHVGHTLDVDFQLLEVGDDVEEAGLGGLLLGGGLLDQPARAAEGRRPLLLQRRDGIGTARVGLRLGQLRLKELSGARGRDTEVGECDGYERNRQSLSAPTGPACPIPRGL